MPLFWLNLSFFMIFNIFEVFFIWVLCFLFIFSVVWVWVLIFLI